MRVESDVSMVVLRKVDLLKKEADDTRNGRGFEIELQGRRGRRARGGGRQAAERSGVAKLKSIFPAKNRLARYQTVFLVFRLPLMI